MKKLTRPPLSRRTTKFLQQRTDKVQTDADPGAEASRLWQFRKNRAFEEIRGTLREMASGIENCMYCEYGEATDIDHFWPRSRFPLLAFSWLNYLLACSNCNSNYKRAEFPLDEAGNPLLLEPTIDEPLEHLVFLPLSGQYVGLSEKGNRSIEVFGLSRETLRRSRRNAWVSLQELIVRYVACKEQGDEQRAEDIRRTVAEHPFASILERLIDLVEHTEARAFIKSDCLDVLQQHPEIKSWSRKVSEQ